MTGEKTCPACDSQIGESDTTCAQCGVFIGMFDEEVNAIGTPGKESEAQVIDLLETIEKSGESEEITVIEKIISIGKTVPVSGEEFPCPSCGTMLPVSATSCTKCNAQFAEEGVQGFQCPICQTMVDADAEKCPSCGALFVEEEPVEEKETEKDDAKERKKKEGAKGEGEKKPKKKKGETGWSKLMKRKK